MADLEALRQKYSRAHPMFEDLARTVKKTLEEATRKQIYADYLEDGRHPLISQPESLLIFERLEHDRFKLAEVWARSLPESMLVSLSAIWGKPVPA